MSDDSQEVMRRLFGLVLGHLRDKQGLSLRKLAQQAHYDAAWLSRTEHGDHLPPVGTVAHIDTALHADRLLVELRDAIATAGRATPTPVAGGGPEDDVVMLELSTPEGGSIRVRISRRDFNRLVATGSLAVVFPGLGGEDASRLAHALKHPAHIDDQVLGYFRRILGEYFTADQALGPRRLLPPVLAQINVLDALRREAGGQHSEPLLGVLAQYAEMTGWLHQDLGHLGEAMRWSQRAAEWARCAGDHQMAAYMLVRQSNIACLTDDRAAVIEYAAGARKSPDLEPKLVALASQQEARGHALRGDHATAAQLLADAAELLDDHPHISRLGAPEYLHHYDLETLEEQSAVCLRLAGDTDTAIGILERKIATIPIGVVRDRGHLTAKLAVTLTYGPGPDPNQAARLGAQALEAAHQTGSARIRRELTDLDQQLTQHWPDLPEAQQLHDALCDP